MSYGIQIDGVDVSGTYNVADSTLPAKNYYVASTGTFSTGVNVGTIGDRDLFLVRPGTGHNNSYMYASQGYAVGSAVGRLITTENNQGRITAASLQTRTMEYVHLKDANAGTAPTSSNYGIQIKNSTGGILFDTRRIVTNNSFRITNYTTEGQAGGFFGVLYSGSDANSKFVDMTATRAFFRQFSGGSGASLFYGALIRWASNQINWYSRVQLYTQESGVLTDNYLSSPALTIGDRR